MLTLNLTRAMGTSTIMKKESPHQYRPEQPREAGRLSEFSQSKTTLTEYRIKDLA